MKGRVIYSIQRQKVEIHLQEEEGRMVIIFKVDSNGKDLTIGLINPQHD